MPSPFPARFAPLVIATMAAMSCADEAPTDVVTGGAGGQGGEGGSSPMDCTPLQDPFDEATCPTDFPGLRCVVYVDGDAASSGDGLSWDQALGSVQEGIDLARCGAVTTDNCPQWDVWVKAGTYYTAQRCREDSLWMRPRVALYGGFDGTESERHQRDWETRPTILDARDGPDGERNAYRVLIGADDSTLDGFTIQHGLADHPTELKLRSGGGIGIAGHSPIIRNCLFRHNRALEAGGAVAVVYGGNPTVENCRFENNRSVHGGAMVFAYDAKGSVVGNTFENNHAERVGGAIYAVDDGHPTLDNNLFANNVAEWWGGGVTMQVGHVTSTGDTFLANRAPHAGALSFNNNATGVVEGAFIEGHGDGDTTRGGGIDIWHDSSVTLRDSILRDNVARDGAAIHAIDSDLVLHNVVVADNQAARWGGGLFARTTDITIRHATFTNNVAFDGGAIAITTSTLAAHNSIFWGDLPNELPAWVSATVRYSVVEGGHPGDGNSAEDPLFVNPGEGDWRLLSGSPAIDASDVDESLDRDLEGKPRHDDPTMADGPACTIPCADRGAYERTN